MLAVIPVFAVIQCFKTVIPVFCSVHDIIIYYNIIMVILHSVDLQCMVSIVTVI